MSERKILLTIALLLALALFLVFIVPFLVPWTGLNCWHEDIDISCGRYRYQRYIFFVKTADRVEETPISRRYRAFVGPAPGPKWRRVNTFSPGIRHSPHYHHHGSLAAAHVLELALASDAFTPDAQSVAVKRFFDLLQSENSDSAASGYAQQMPGMAVEAKDNSLTIRLKDIRAANR